MTPASTRVIALVCVLIGIFPSLGFVPSSVAGAIGEIEMSWRGDSSGATSPVPNRAQQLAGGLTALFLDALVYAALWGLVAIVFNLLSRRWQLAVWIISIIAGLGSAAFRYPDRVAQRDFVFMVLDVPFVVGVLSILGLFLTRRVAPVTRRPA